MEHTARKRFGQHFLHNPGVIQRILVAVAPKPGQPLVEIGPGRGALTRGLVEAAGRLAAVELDRDLLGTLYRLAELHPGLTIHHADALEFDLCALYPGQRLRLVGNLPYNISTPLLFRFIDQRDCIQDMHVMLQKEVVDRINAQPGTRVYGRLSVMVQTYCSTKALFKVRPGAFTPAPKVDSSFLRLVPHRPLPVAVQDPNFLARLVAQAFSQRRKTLRNSLKGLVDADLFRAQGLDPGQRPEQLGFQTYVHLANAACKTHAAP